MRLYVAPMEGLTTCLWRKLQQQHFGGADRYFSPFLSPNSNPSLDSKELTDVLPGRNEGVPLTPQILSNHGSEFLFTAEKLRRLGYEEVNLNLGCPSGTVTAKGRGAGFLARRAELERFLDEIFSACPLSISIKTRLGMESAEEFPALLALYNRYPVKELIVHPRVRQEFYQGAPHWDAFDLALRESRAPVCYNGDIFTLRDAERLRARFPGLQALMLGRGVVADPSLLRRLRGEGALSKEELRRFHDALLAAYESLGWSERNVLFRMKELWQYMGCVFESREKYVKRIHKAQCMTDYLMAVDALFREQPLLRDGGYQP